MPIFSRWGEAEVLYFVVKGKINRGIGDILGSSRMAVKKQLEQVFTKLGGAPRCGWHGDEPHSSIASAV